MSANGLALAVVAALALVAACTIRDETYCDQEVQCSGTGDWCNLETKTCEPKADAAVDAARDRADDQDGSGQDAREDAPPATDAGCESPQRQCGGYCYAVDDPAHCGASCEQCTVPANGSATCDGTSCDFTCNGGYWKNASTCDACTTTDHCGATCAQCTSPPSNGHPTCDGTTCDFVCDQGYWHNTSTCDLCDDNAHCGLSCVACSGTTPVCDGTPRQCRACQAHAECASGACDADGSCVAEADIVCVDGHAGCPGLGTVANPFCNFPPALGLVSPQRWRIVVRAGSYSLPTTQTISNTKVAVIGAAADTTELVYQGAINAPALAISGTSDVSLFGLTIRGATGADGHGVSCRDTTATPSLAVDRCIVTGNGGTGVYAQHAAVTVTRSTIANNAGLGVALFTGGQLTISESTISGNAQGVFSTGQATISRCIVSQNLGPGVTLQGDYSVTNCLIVGNGHTTPTGTAGGAALSASGTTMEFVNNTVVDNNATSSAPGGVSCTNSAPIVNSIIWANSANPGYEVSGCTVTYSDVGIGGGGTGDLSVDPKFVNAGAGNYQLSTSPASPCINAGTTTGAPTVDLDGYPRSGNPDMGCYEAH